MTTTEAREAVTAAISDATITARRAEADGRLVGLFAQVNEQASALGFYAGKFATEERAWFEVSRRIPAAPDVCRHGKRHCRRSLNCCLANCHDFRASMLTVTARSSFAAGYELARKRAAR